MERLKAAIKKIFHRHKYETLKMYPPRPKYFDHHWGFLIECKCGHSKLAKLPSCINYVNEMVSVDLINLK